MYAQSTLWDPLPYNSPCTLAVQVPRQAGSVWGPGSIPGRFWRTGVPSSGVAWQGHCTSALLSICRPAIALTFVHVRGRLKKKKKQANMYYRITKWMGFKMMTNSFLVVQVSSMYARQKIDHCAGSIQRSRSNHYNRLGESGVSFDSLVIPPEKRFQAQVVCTEFNIVKLVGELICSRITQLSTH